MKLTKKIFFVILLLCIVFSLVFFFLFRLINRTGLGLNISYNIIRNHGGKITMHEHYHNSAHLIVHVPLGDTRNDRKANTTDN
jgi:signal transduction histidine kinase